MPAHQSPYLFAQHTPLSYVHCPNLIFVQWLGCAYQGRTFTGARQKFWPEALRVATNDSYGCQWELNPWVQLCYLKDHRQTIPKKLLYDDI